MTPLAPVERKGDFSVTRAAVSAFDIQKHRVVDCTFLGSGKYVGMADFTAIPDGMLLVREADGGDPGVMRFHKKIFPAVQRRPLNRYAFEKVDRLDGSTLLRSLPIHAVNVLREFRGVRLVGVLPYARFTQ